MINTTIAHYKITSKLGQGGMGEVYRATDTKLDRDVAIKVLPESFAQDEERLKRFEREAKALAKLNHPNIASIHGFDQHEGQWFLVLELVEGLTLAERLEEGPLEMAEALETGRQIAEALEAAHDKGIIHRDLKPANIKIDPQGRVKVLDFGLAKTLPPAATLLEDSANPAEAPTLTGDYTEPGKVMGTASYMSPEQSRGLEVDRRTDVWAFGCCLYETLTGKKPFKGKTAPDLVADILRSDPDLTIIPPETPGEVLTLLRRCLDKDPRRRLRDLGDIAFTLEDTQEGLKSDFQSRRVVPTPQAKGVPLWAVGVMALLMILIGVVFMRPDGNSFSSGNSNDAPRIKSLAVLPFENQSGDPDQEYFVDGMTGALTSELSKISSIKVIGRSSAMHYKGTDKSPREIAEELGVDGLITGSAFQADDQVRITAELMHAATQSTLWSEDYDNTSKNVLKLHSEVALDISAAILATLSEAEKSSYASTQEVNPAAYDLYLRGQQIMGTRTEEDIEEAIRLFEQAIKIDSTFALGYSGLADSHLLMVGHWFRTEEDVRERIETYIEKALSLDPDSSEAHASLGLMIFLFNEELEKAERHFRRALELDAGNSEAARWYGLLLITLGRTSEAIEQVTRAIELDPKGFLPQINLARAYFLDRDYQRAHDIQARMLKNQPNNPLMLTSYAAILSAMGRHDEAIAAGTKAHEISNSARSDLYLVLLQVLGGDLEVGQSFLSDPRHQSRDALTLQGLMVGLHVSMGNYDEALRLLPQFLKRNVLHDRLSPLMDPLRDYPAFWEYYTSLGYPPLPAEHPLYAKEQEWKIRQAAAEMLREQGSGGPQLLERIAVLPFENLSDEAGQAYFVNGMTDGLTTELQKISKLLVISSAATRVYRDTTLPLKDIAKELAVDGLVTGSVYRAGNDIKITAQLTDPSTLGLLWSDEYMETMENVIAVQGQATLAIANAIRVVVSEEERERIADELQISPRAYESFLRGRERAFETTSDGLSEALKHFAEAHTLAPHWTAPLEAAASAHYIGTIMALKDASAGEMKSLAQQAIKIDAHAAEAHAILASTYWRYEYRWQDAERGFKKALSIAPNSAMAHIAYAEFLSMTGRRSEAVDHLIRARELAGDDESLLRLIGEEYLDAGQTVTAISILEPVFANRPNDAFVAINLSQCHIAKGDADKGVRVLRELVETLEHDPMYVFRLGMALVHAGRVDEGMEHIDELSALEPFKSGVIFQLLRALLLGDVDRAFAAMERAVQERMPLAVWYLRVRVYTDEDVLPIYREMRQDARFWALIEKIGYPPLPPDHPGYAEEQAWKIKRAAAEMVREADGPQLLERIAVLPFENQSTEEGQAFFVNGMTDALTSELRKISNLMVISSSATRQYRDTTLTLKDIADELGVDGLVTGSVYRSGNDIQITADLTDPDTLGSLWSETYNDTMENVITVQGQATLAIADAIRVAVSEEEQTRIARKLQIDPRAYELYLRARELFLELTETSMTEAAKLFEEAHRAEPDWPDPLVAAAQLYHYGSLMGVVPSDIAKDKMTDLASRALLLDKDLADAISIVATARWRFGYDFAGAETALRRAVTLAPNSPMARILYGKFLVQLGRRNEAIEQLDAALNISQGDFLLMTLIGDDLTDAQPERALTILEEVVANKPDYGFAVLGLANAYLGSHQPAKALQVTEAYMARVDNSPLIAFLAFQLSLAGRFEEAKSINDRLEREGFFERDVAARLNFSMPDIDVDAYIDLLTVLLEERNVGTIWQIRIAPYKYEGVEPRYKELRQSPRYWELIERIGLPPLPPDHPGYAEEQAWKIKQAAAEMVREQGLVDLNDAQFDPLRNNPQFQAIVEQLQSSADSLQEEED